MRDPYEILGLDRKASSSDVKTAFRRSAKKLHPDANKNDPKAASRFAELNAAYEILGDEAKRQAFDRGEIDSEGKPQFRGFEGFGAGAGSRPGAGFGPDAEFETFSFGPEGFTRATRRGRGGSGAGFGGFEDILREAFGGGGGRRGAGRSAFEAEDPARADVAVAFAVSLPEAAQGTTQRLRLPSGKDVEVKNSRRNHQRPADQAARPGDGWSGRHWRCSDHGFNSTTSHFHSRWFRRSGRSAANALRRRTRGQGSRPDAGQAGGNHCSARNQQRPYVPA